LNQLGLHTLSPIGVFEDRQKLESHFLIGKLPEDRPKRVFALVFGRVEKKGAKDMDILGEQTRAFLHLSMKKAGMLLFDPPLPMRADPKALKDPPFLFLHET
jgi:hypothetical protein